METSVSPYTQVPKADSWITEEQFFAGLGVVQAMPGPLFNLAAGAYTRPLVSST
jgi:hypothetical protein